MLSNNAHKIISKEPLDIKAYWREFIKYRYLIWVFSYQEFKVQYVQTRLNFLWAVLRPLMVLTLFTFIFDKLIKIPGLHYPYPLFAFTGLLVWNNFSFLVNNGGNVIVTNQTLIKKIYFPRIILIFSKLLVSLVELGISLILILLLMVVIGYPFSVKIVLLPVFLAISMVTGLMIATWLNTLNIKFRDWHQIVPTLTGFLIWLTPVFYPVTLIPKSYSFVLYLNPISAAIQGCRWAILGDTMPSIYYLPAILVCAVLFAAGLVVFIKAEGDLADYI